MKAKALKYLCTVFAGAAIVLAASQLQQSDIYRISDSTSATHVQYHRIEIPRDRKVVLADLAGPGKITYFYITDDSGGRLYPGLVLQVFWDDEQDPSVCVPLSDFFGAIQSKTIDYQSLPMQINHFCYMSYLPMPFARRARFTLVNDGTKDYSRSVAYGIDYEKGKDFDQERSRLHCTWNRSNPTRGGMHTLLDAAGRGHYIGGFLQVYSRYKGWWGEGDTIFTVDNKSMTHTPGTEDEYGSCWGFEHLYSYIYSGYIQMGEGQNRMYRWYVQNPVRFQNTLKVNIQNQRWEHGQVASSDDYTSVAFWYQEEPHRTFKLQPFEERTAASQAAEYQR